jgi:alcohol dehydrogenase (NADP+)
MKTWRKMEELVDLGLVRHIGTSNMTIPKLKLVLRDARIKPAVNEMELHPHFQQPELFQFVVENGIQPIGYCPIGSPGRPERDRTPEDTAPTEDPGDRGDRPAPRNSSRGGVHQVGRAARANTDSLLRQHYRANLAGVAGDPLSDDEMRAIAAIDRNCRLIKGQVFLWKDGQSWEDLWDPNGEITPP